MFVRVCDSLVCLRHFHCMLFLLFVLLLFMFIFFVWREEVGADVGCLLQKRQKKNNCQQRVQVDWYE